MQKTTRRSLLSTAGLAAVALPTAKALAAGHDHAAMDHGGAAPNGDPGMAHGGAAGPTFRAG